MNHKEFIENKINPLMKVLVSRVLKKKPENILEFMKEWVDDQIKEPTYLKNYEKIKKKIELYNTNQNINNTQETDKEIKNKGNDLIDNNKNENLIEKIQENNSNNKNEVSTDKKEEVIVKNDNPVDKKEDNIENKNEIPNDDKNENIINKEDKSSDKKEDNIENKKEATPEDKKEVTPEDKKEVTPEDKKEVTPEDKKEVTPEDKKEDTPEDKKEDKKEENKEDKKEDKKEENKEDKKEENKEDKKEGKPEDIKKKDNIEEEQDENLKKVNFKDINEKDIENLEFSDDENDVMDEKKLEEMNKKFKNKKKESVSAESYGKYNKLEDFKPRLIEKDESTCTRLKTVLDKIYFFKNLDQKDKEIIINAIELKPVKKDEVIIKQEDKGDNLYIIDKGQYKCFKKYNDEEKLIKTYEEGDYFGELALLYNAPRATTIIAQNEGNLLSLDRYTFNNIVKTSASNQREIFSEFLKKIEILNDLDDYEKSKLSDCLIVENFKNNDYIIKQGEIGDKFYFIIEGTAIATEISDNGVEKTIFEYNKENDYFGELSLLKNEKRAANIKVTSDTFKIAYLDKESFRRLLGPIEDILTRNKEKYDKYIKSNN